MCWLHKLKIMPLLVVALSACSQSSQTTDYRATSREFSAEEKRIARALSIGQQEDSGGATAQYRATLCSLALASVMQSLKDSGALSAEQEQALAQASEIFNRRATAGLTRSEILKNREDVEMAHPGEASRARFAISCVRDLA